MANTYSKISNLINSQVPFFVRNDHQKFVTFLEKYYEYLEQDDELIARLKNIQKFQNIDLTEDEFAQRLYTQFLSLIPEFVKADKNILVKHIKDFYRARGTEKSIRFLINLIYGITPEFYYPKKDILRASDGKWYIEKTLRVNDTKLSNSVNNITLAYTSNDSVTILEQYKGKRIVGELSGASAFVEGTNRFFEAGLLIDELILSNIKSEFDNGETIITIIEDPIEGQKYLKSNVYSGILNLVTIENPGAGYSLGTQIPLISDTGSNGSLVITKVSSGKIDAINLFESGAGYRVNDLVLILGGGGSGANANVATVYLDESIHPNSYSIVASTIDLVQNELLGYANVYTVLNNSNVNTSIANAVSYWIYSNTGPARTINVINPGSNYSSNPILSISGNTHIASLGILGRMKIIDGGINYAIGDVIRIDNQLGGYGVGAAANVRNVAANGMITEVKFVQVPGHFIGGSGYRQSLLPTTTVISANGTGANVLVTHILSVGAEMKAANSTIGAIEQITVKTRGSGYEEPPTLDLTGLGDGTALANVSIVQGVYTYPGRYLNDDGHLSSCNYLEDRDYYQLYSYVVRSNKSLSDYEKTLYNTVHPAGTKLFGEYVYIGETTDYDLIANNSSNSNYTFVVETYTKTMNTINISYASHGKSIGANVYMEFDKANVENALYTIWFTDTNYFKVNSHSQSLTINNSNNSGYVTVTSITSINT